jgi:hypothetical protein
MQVNSGYNRPPATVSFYHVAVILIRLTQGIYAGSL